MGKMLRPVTTDNSSCKEPNTENGDLRKLPALAVGEPKLCSLEIGYAEFREANPRILRGNSRKQN
jgi:hypothetical protein